MMGNRSKCGDQNLFMRFLNLILLGLIFFQLFGCAPRIGSGILRVNTTFLPSYKPEVIYLFFKPSSSTGEELKIQQIICNNIKEGLEKEAIQVSVISEINIEEMKPQSWVIKIILNSQFNFLTTTYDPWTRRSSPLNITRITADMSGSECVKGIGYRVPFLNFDVTLDALVTYPTLTESQRAGKETTATVSVRHKKVETAAEVAKKMGVLLLKTILNVGKQNQSIVGKWTDLLGGTIIEFKKTGRENQILGIVREMSQSSLSSIVGFKPGTEAYKILGDPIYDEPWHIYDGYDRTIYLDGSTSWNEARFKIIGSMLHVISPTSGPSFFERI